MKLALLGRDGVINKALAGGVNHRTKLELIVGSIDAVAQLTKAGFRVMLDPSRLEHKFQFRNFVFTRRLLSNVRYQANVPFSTWVSKTQC